MIAYNNQWLYNLYVRSQADAALEQQCITPAMHEDICKSKEVKFYTPNFFVRIGLAILTLIITSFASALFMLMSGAGSHGIGFLLFFIGASCYAVAELFIRSKAHYNSGVDNMLVWMAALMLWSAFFVMAHGGHSEISLSFAALFICAALALRFADALLSIAATVALAGAVFFICQHAGGFAGVVTPLAMMLLSAVIYFASGRLMRYEGARFYQYCLLCVSVAALVLLYASGNYYMVSELSSRMPYRESALRESLPMGWFFWLWTFLIPVIYIAIGIRKKNAALIRTGIPLIAVAIITFRYYHSLLAPEMAMLIGGAALFIISYSLISYLREPRGGFTFKPDTHVSDRPDLGRMITGEAISHSAQAEHRQESDTW